MLNLCVLMPTYGRTAALVENAIACYQRQTYPQQHRFLLCCDDEPWWNEQAGDRWQVERFQGRAPDLGAKYNLMMRFAEETRVAGWVPDAYVVWDDDDLYLPWHLEAYAAALERHAWAHPRTVWSTYTGSPTAEAASGRFHGSLAIRRGAGQWIETLRGTFDQEMIAQLQSIHGDPGRPDERFPPSYVFRWADTGSHHCQAYMKGTDREWYEDYALAVFDRRQAMGESPPEVLVPQLDDAGRRTIGQIQMILSRSAR